MSTTELKPLWTLVDKDTDKHYPVWESLSKRDAHKFLSLVDKLDKLKNKGKLSPAESQQALQGMQKLVSMSLDILHRCLRLSTEEFVQIPDNEVSSLVGQFAMIVVEFT